MFKQWFCFFLFLAVFIAACEKNEVNDPCLPNLSINDKTSREQDDRALVQLLKELMDLSASVTCTGSTDWNYVPYGTKACGGPLGFIPYHNSIDVECFKKKVALYTDLTKLYNNKHGVFSDCSIPPSPKSVACENGKPVLRY